MSRKPACHGINRQSCRLIGSPVAAVTSFFANARKRARNIHVDISPDLVVRPGDLVLIGVKGEWGDERKPDRIARIIRSRLEPMLPKGARIAFVGASRAKATVHNLTRLTEQLANNLVNESTSNNEQEPFTPSPYLGDSIGFST